MGAYPARWDAEAYDRPTRSSGRLVGLEGTLLKEELEDVHTLFKAAVSRYRPSLDLDAVATGEHWYGTRALELGLADDLGTSDELLASLAAERELFRVHFKIKKPLQKRLMANVDGALERLDAAGELARTTLPGELIAEELRQAHGALGEGVGEMSSDQLLGEIFSRFCIGK